MHIRQTAPVGRHRARLPQQGPAHDRPAPRSSRSVLDAADDHPDVVELHRRAAEVDDRISLSTVYRTVKLFETEGILERLDFRDGRSPLRAGGTRAPRPPDQSRDRRRDRVPLRGDRGAAEPRSPSGSATGSSITGSSSMRCPSTRTRREPHSRVACAAAAARPVRPRARCRCRCWRCGSAGRPAASLPVWFHRIFLRALQRARDRARHAACGRADPGPVEPRLLARHSGDRLAASALLHRQIGGRGLAGGRAFWRGCSARCSSTAQRRKATAEVNDALAHRLVEGRGASCCSPKAPRATATACCPSAPRWSARPRPRSCTIAPCRSCSSRWRSPIRAATACPSPARERPFIAWYGDMELAPHLAAASSMAAPLDVVVTWGEPIPFNGRPQAGRPRWPRRRAKRSAALTRRHRPRTRLCLCRGQTA